MVKIADIRKNIKEKILLIGDSSTGKTHICLRVAIELSKMGKKVIYIDPEFGTQKEFELLIEKEKLSDKDIENIDLRIETDFVGLYDSIVEKSDCYLKIIDSFDDVLRLNREYLEREFVKAGYYVVGDKKIGISHPETFVLPWNVYPKLYSNIVNSIYEILRHDYHFICATKPFGGSESRQELENLLKGKFDTVIQTRRELVTVEGSGGIVERPKWIGFILKNRGREDETTNLRVTDIDKSLVNRFLELEK